MEDLTYHGLINQTTIKDLKTLNTQKFNFYLGVDPSSDSMTIGNLASLMLVTRFIQAGHKGYLLVGGATGLIGDPDMTKKRTLIDKSIIESNVIALKKQMHQIIGNDSIEILNNYDWLKNVGYLEFLREIGTHVPLRTMLNRDFVEKRVDDKNIGLSYAEFSYSLIQGYDFYFLNKTKQVNLQLCGADQWGNSIAGVDIIRRITGEEAHVLSIPLVINKQTGRKFGKSEEGAIWLSADKTSVFQFYQFFINLDDQNIEYYLKIYTFLNQSEIELIMREHQSNFAKRVAQKELAYQVTKIVHGEELTKKAVKMTEFLNYEKDISLISDIELQELSKELPSIKISHSDLNTILMELKLVKSKTEANQLLSSGAIYINNNKVNSLDIDKLKQSKVNIIRRGKAYKDSALLIT